MHKWRSHFVPIVLCLSSVYGCGEGSGNSVVRSAVAVVIVSGDGQVVDQHSFISQPLAVRVVDANNQGVNGVEVTFSAPSGSDFITPTIVTTVADGSAEWQGYVHADDGQQLVEAATNGLPNAIFTLGVTPSIFAYDGLYECDFFMDNGTRGDSGYLTYRIDNGEPFNASLDEFNGGPYYSKSLDEADGSISLVQRWSLDLQLWFTGELLISSDQRATGSGTWVKLNMLQPIPSGQLGEEDFGIWNCERQ